MKSIKKKAAAKFDPKKRQNKRDLENAIYTCFKGKPKRKQLLSRWSVALYPDLEMLEVVKAYQPHIESYWPQVEDSTNDLLVIHFTEGTKPKLLKEFIAKLEAVQGYPLDKTYSHDERIAYMHKEAKKRTTPAAIKKVVADAKRLGWAVVECELSYKCTYTNRSGSSKIDPNKPYPDYLDPMTLKGLALIKETAKGLWVYMYVSLKVSKVTHAPRTIAFRLIDESVSKSFIADLEATSGT